MTYDTKKIIYNTIVKPQFEYCSTIYFICTRKQVSQMQKIQNKALRLILKCDYQIHRENLCLMH